MDEADAHLRRVRRVPAILAVLALAGPLALALPRLVDAEAPGRLILLAAFDRQLLVAAAAGAVLGVAARSRVLMAVGLVLTVLWALWVGPQLVELVGSRTVPAGDGTIRVVSANLYYENERVTEALAVLAAAEADVVVLQEVGPRAAAALQGGALGEGLALLGMRPRTSPYGWAVLSRFPGVVEEVRVGEERTGCVRLTTPAGPVRVLDVHTMPPTGDLRSRWEEDLADLTALIRAEAPDAARPPAGGGCGSSEEGPLVLAGDFNATAGHRAFRRVLDAGVRDATVAAGRGWVSTWPARLPAVRLDHVLVPEGVDVVAAGELDLPGSDHRGVRADLTLPGAR